MPAEGVESAADALCMQCGLCCNGTFYGSVIVADGERARLERVGLRVVLHDGSTTMPQPCTACAGRLCAVYADRPTACASYACSLRKRVSAGEESLGAALAKVTKMEELLAVIRTTLECAPAASIWERVLALEPPPPETEAVATKDYAAALDAVGELIALGRAAFEPRFAGGGSR